MSPAIASSFSVKIVVSLRSDAEESLPEIRPEFPSSTFDYILPCKAVLA